MQIIIETAEKFMLLMKQHGVESTIILEDRGVFGYISSDCIVCHVEAMVEIIDERGLQHRNVPTQVDVRMN